MSRHDKVYRRDVRVRCLNDGTEYTATQTIREFGSDEGNMIGRNEEPPNGLCPTCRRPDKEIIEA